MPADTNLLNWVIHYTPNLEFLRINTPCSHEKNDDNEFPSHIAWHFEIDEKITALREMTVYNYWNKYLGPGDTRAWNWSRMTHLELRVLQRRSNLKSLARPKQLFLRTIILHDQTYDYHVQNSKKMEHEAMSLRRS